MRNQNPRIVYMNRARSHIPEIRYKGNENFVKWQEKAR